MQWVALKDKSSVEWTVSYGAKPVTGVFNDLNAEITFDPEHLEQARVVVVVDMPHVTAEDKDVTESVKGQDWLDVAKFPQARFEAVTFRHIAEEQYEAEGTLTLGEKTNKLVLPFTVHFYEDKENIPPVRYAQVTADTTLKRLDYGIGRGEWSKTDVVADDVRLLINLKAKQKSE